MEYTNAAGTFGFEIADDQPLDLQIAARMVAFTEEHRDVFIALDMTADDAPTEISSAEVQEVLTSVTATREDILKLFKEAVAKDPAVVSGDEVGEALMHLDSIMVDLMLIKPKDTAPGYCSCPTLKSPDVSVVVRMNQSIDRS